MNKEFIFPLLSVVLAFGAAAIYFIEKDIPRGIYWILGASITITVTWLIK